MAPTNSKLGKASSSSAHIDAANSDLRQILVERIDRNPENPRILFRQGELEQTIVNLSKPLRQEPVCKDI